MLDGNSGLIANGSQSLLAKASRSPGAILDSDHAHAKYKAAKARICEHFLNDMQPTKDGVG